MAAGCSTPAWDAGNNRRACARSHPTSPSRGEGTDGRRSPCAVRSRAWWRPPSLLPFRLEGEDLRLLRLVRMLRAGVDLELDAQLLAAERGLREHAVHRLLDHALGLLGEHGREGREALVPHVSGVAV